MSISSGSKLLLFYAMIVSIAGCRTLSSQIRSQDETPSQSQNVEVLLDNTSAYQKKLVAIESATSSIDMAYFIVAIDSSTALLLQKTVEKAQAGVKVRILLDALMTMQQRQYFRALQSQGNGNIEIVYFRPAPEEIWQDLQTWGFPNRELILSTVGNPKGGGLLQLLMQNPIYKKSRALRVLVGRFYPATITPDLALSLAGDYLMGRTIEQILIKDFAAVQEEIRGATFRLNAWLNAGKRLHHKLLIVDQKYVVGGGRNLGNHYHLHTLDPNDKDAVVFDDADFALNSPKIASNSMLFIDDLWKCAKAPSPAPGQAPACPVGIVAEAETITTTASAKRQNDKLFAEIQALAAKHAAQSTDNETADPKAATAIVATPRPNLSAPTADVRYIENRMYPKFRGAERLNFGEEESLYNLETRKLITATKAGEEIIFHNAYIFFTPLLYSALLDAIKRQVKISIYGNSRHSPDQGYLSVLALPQYAFLKQWAKTHNNPHVHIYQYTSKHSAIHNKVSLIGKHMIVGSGNLDPRSQLLDTQNGIIINPGAHNFVEQYRQWLTGLSAEQTRYPNGQVASKIVELTEENLAQLVPRLDEVLANEKRYNHEQQFLARLADLVKRAYESDTSEAELYRGILTAAFLNI